MYWLSFLIRLDACPDFSSRSLVVYFDGTPHLPTPDDDLMDIDTITEQVTTNDQSLSATNDVEMRDYIEDDEDLVMSEPTIDEPVAPVQITVPLQTRTETIPSIDWAPQHKLYLDPSLQWVKYGAFSQSVLPISPTVFSPVSRQETTICPPLHHPIITSIAVPLTPSSPVTPSTPLLSTKDSTATLGGSDWEDYLSDPEMDPQPIISTDKGKGRDPAERPTGWTQPLPVLWDAENEVAPVEDLPDFEEEDEEPSSEALQLTGEELEAPFMEPFTSAAHLNDLVNSIIGDAILQACQECSSDEE
jgi:hypothetical protein